MEESKHIATHPHLGRGSTLRSVDYQKRASQKRLLELEVIKRHTVRDMYPLLTSLVPLRNMPMMNVPKDDRKTKQKNQENDRRAGSLKALTVQKLSSLHVRAFTLGLHASDPRLNLTSEDLMWIHKAFREEVGYFDRFFDAIRNGSLSAKQVNHRLWMYMASSNATFESGRVAGASKNSLIYWIVDPFKENCKICLFLQSNSPFTVQNLPAVPGSDACEGYSNCGCKLSYVRADPDVLKTVKQKSKSKQQLLTMIGKMRKQRHVA